MAYTRTLLGHKREEKTDNYNDDRDQGWKHLVVKKQSVLQKGFAGVLQKTRLTAAENEAASLELSPEDLRKPAGLNGPD